MPGLRQPVHPGAPPALLRPRLPAGGLASPPPPAGHSDDHRPPAPSPARRHRLPLSRVRAALPRRTVVPGLPATLPSHRCRWAVPPLRRTRGDQRPRRPTHAIIDTRAHEPGTTTLRTTRRDGVQRGQRPPACHRGVGPMRTPSLLEAAIMHRRLAASTSFVLGCAASGSACGRSRLTPSRSGAAAGHRGTTGEELISGHKTVGRVESQPPPNPGRSTRRRSSPTPATRNCSPARSARHIVC